MSRRNRPPRSPHHPFRLGELLRLTRDARPFDEGTIVQVLAFRGEQLRVKPLNAIPLLVHYTLLERVGLPSGSSKPPRRRRPRQPAKAASSR